jgi:hypothetical protein
MWARPKIRRDVRTPLRIKKPDISQFHIRLAIPLRIGIKEDADGMSLALDSIDTLEMKRNVHVCNPQRVVQHLWGQTDPNQHNAHEVKAVYKITTPTIQEFPMLFPFIKQFLEPMV